MSVLAWKCVLFSRPENGCWMPVEPQDSTRFQPTSPPETTKAAELNSAAFRFARAWSGSCLGLELHRQLDFGLPLLRCHGEVRLCRDNPKGRCPVVERLKSRSNGRVCESGGRLLVLRHRKDACGDHLVPAARFAEHRDQRAKGPVGMVEMGFVDSDQLPGEALSKQMHLLVARAFEG